jgi:hypothetical protein
VLEREQRVRGRYIDVPCSFYGGVWSYANFYDASGSRLAYRESPESFYIC